MNELIELPIINLPEHIAHRQQVLAMAGQAADRAAAAASFAEYKSRVSKNTLRTQKAGLDCFATFLDRVDVGGFSGADFQNDPMAWSGMSWGLVAAFVQWMLQQGYAVATVNNRLSVVKVYAEQAMMAGMLEADDIVMIRSVKGYGGKPAQNLDEQRKADDIPIRIGRKKAEHVSLSPDQAQQLKNGHEPTPQGLRDRFMICLLLDHGLRASEVARLQVNGFDLRNGRMEFYRPKVNKTQIHLLTDDTLQAAQAYLYEPGPAQGGVILGSKKNGELRSSVMSEVTISRRVNVLGKLAGIWGLSAHDCRHYWATQAARNKTDAFDLQTAGGWSSLAMPRRYVEESEIANSGVKLG